MTKQWTSGFPNDGINLPFWGWSKETGVRWVYWRGGAFQIREAQYPAARVLTHSLRAYPETQSPFGHEDYYWETKPNGTAPSPPITFQDKKY